MAKYTPWLKSDLGVSYGPLDRHLGFSYAKGLNTTGWFKITLPADFELAPGIPIGDYLAVDRQVQFWRRSELTSEPVLDFVGLLRKWQISTKNGVSTVTLEGPDFNDLLKRRIVAYIASHNFSMTVPHTDGLYYFPFAMTEMVRQNMGSDVEDADRDLSNFVSVQSGEKKFNGAFRHIEWKTLEAILSEMNAESRARGTETFWQVLVTGVDADGELQLDFSALTDSPGTDRRWSTSSNATPMVFGLRWGNLLDPVLTYDYTNEVNYVYVGGPGEAQAREVVELADDQRIAMSVWNRQEAFVSATRATSTIDLEGEGYSALNAGRPKVIFSGKILSSEQTPYGEWGLGSYVTIEYLSRTFNGLVRTVEVTVDANGQDTASSAVEYVEDI